MNKMRFDSSGRFIGLQTNSQILEFKEYEEKEENQKLLRSEDLSFLKEEKETQIEEKEYWSLYEKEKPLNPLKFSNGKTQEEIVSEIVQSIKSGEKLIFLKGVCGSGKSAIALNVARVIGKTSVVVPIKSLQKQYEKDYVGKKYLLKNGKKLKIAVITGRENHDSIILPGVSCADPFLPDTIKITDKNFDKIKEYYENNPFIKNKELPPVKALKRISIAPANPYWSPILPAEIEMNQMKDAKKKKYEGMFGREYIFYHRKNGCSYYDQYQAYIDADVIIFNSAKYLAESSIGRKPATEADIIDEADEFLDSFSENREINLTRLSASLKSLNIENPEAKKARDIILNSINLEEVNKKALGIDEEQIFRLESTKIIEILQTLLQSQDLQSEIYIEDTNYSSTVLEIATDFKDSLKDAFLTYRREEESLYVNLVTTNLSARFKEILDGNKSLVFMSGTLHSKAVLKNIFGIEKYKEIDAETLNHGNIEIHRVGSEFDCSYSNIQREGYRKKYLLALEKIVEKSKKPALIHVGAFADLPSEKEKSEYSLKALPSREEIYLAQSKDKNGERIIKFKNKETDTLFTTKCSRGVDFPGNTCNSVIFTKYPNPNVKNTFWKILKETHKDFYWEFYKDKAKREFLQRIYRAVRSKEDHVFVLSPDIRVANAIKDIQSASV